MHDAAPVHGGEACKDSVQDPQTFGQTERAISCDLILQRASWQVLRDKQGTPLSRQHIVDRDHIRMLATPSQPGFAQGRLEARTDAVNDLLDHHIAVQEFVTREEGPASAAPSQHTPEAVAPRDKPALRQWMTQIGLGHTNKDLGAAGRDTQLRCEQREVWVLGRAPALAKRLRSGFSVEVERAFAVAWRGHAKGTVRDAVDEAPRALRSQHEQCEQRKLEV